VLKTRSALDIREDLGQEKKVCLICGKFNVVHPGHLRLFRHAKEICDRLVVGIYPDDWSPSVLLPAIDRLEGVQANIWVDDAFLVKDSVEKSIDDLRPDVVLKGKEHEQAENVEKAMVESYGGVLRFSAGDLRLSSSALLRAEGGYGINFLEHADDYLKRHQISKGDLIDQIEAMSDVKTLVIGDLIIDKYIDCHPIGMSAEDPTVVVSPLATKLFVGGAGIVASHASQLGKVSTLVSICGDDEQGKFAMSELEKTGVITRVFSDPDRPTTLKTRYRANNQTLLRVNELRDHQIDRDLSAEIYSCILDTLPAIDLVIFSDFSYGLLTEALVEKTIKAGQRRNLVMAGDSQSSSQVGDLAKFQNLSLLTPTEKEARLAVRDNKVGLVGISKSLGKLTNGKHIPITLGGEGVFLHVPESDGKNWEDDRIPALNVNPVDVSGAGDAFLVSTAICLAVGASIWTATYIGSIASACQVGRMGNVPLSKDDLLQAIRT
jgi:rfaE bifunctional protein kinase chain/domain